MTFRDVYPGPDVEFVGDAEPMRKGCIPLFPALIGLVAAMDIASVIFVLMG